MVYAWRKRLDYEQVKAIIEVRIDEWNHLLKHADARNADITVTIAFEASVGAARIILQDIETAYGIRSAQKDK